MSYLSRFLKAAAAHAHRPAVIEGGRTVCYGELLQVVRRIAFHLVDKGGTGGVVPRVLIHLPQTAEAYAAMFAAGYAGGYYSTTNTAAPLARRQMTFEEFAPTHVVTDRELLGEVRSSCPAAKVVEVDGLSQDELLTCRDPHRLAYVMFTSGSTGRPKGVMITQRALDHYVGWALDAMEVVPDDRWSQHPNIAFDLSVLDIYGALCAGAALVPIAEPADLLMPAKAIRRHQLTVWNSVPSVLTSMIRAKQLTARNFASLRLLTFCGEALQPMHLDGIFAARDDVVVHNTYGPTEATVSCTLARLVSTNYREACRATVAIGQPIPGMSLDIAGSADPREGELVITGPQLAEGYWNQPEATARQFRDFLKGDVMTRAYYTGDWARAIDGHIYFSGRMDNQVKVRGERIELDDIAAALMGCNLGFACVVMVGHSLHGVFERTEDLPAHAALAEMVGAHLPRHLIPQQFHQMPELPRSGNGKVDSAAVKVWLSTKMRISAIVDADFSVIADGVSG